ncbi:exopolysaccharide biosynthesis polyprenyl glycosylphosphotransferase [Candidatus Woesearchaeota archaeon]|nr:exopolysaccharide biosynthesis polyprenyl glycosylphosphotransferase [Candidatus Woesearchaeota archaeon]
MQKLILMISDILSIILGFFLVYWIRFNSGINSDYTPISLFIPLLSYSILLYLIVARGTYTSRFRFDLKEFNLVAKSMMITFLMTLLITYLLKTSTVFSRFIIVGTFIFSFIIIITVRYAIRELAAPRMQNTAIIGMKTTTRVIAKYIQKDKRLGYNLKHVIEPSVDLNKILQQLNNIQVIILTDPHKNPKLTNYLITSPRKWTIKYVPDLMETVSGEIDFYDLKNIPTVTISKKNSHIYAKFTKRVLDISISLIGLLILLPLFAVISILIILLDGTNPVYMQQRLGIGKKKFWMYKFNTMKKIYHMTPSDYPSNYAYKSKNDPRITYFGKILRRTCLDELPQLLNVLKGDMSLVGPRPHLQSELHFFDGWKLARFNARPGITGLWQISGRHELGGDRSCALDVYYINNISFWTDISIILQTIPAIIFSKGNW